MSNREADNVTPQTNHDLVHWKSVRASKQGLRVAKTKGYSDFQNHLLVIAGPDFQLIFFFHPTSFQCSLIGIM